MIIRLYKRTTIHILQIVSLVSSILVIISLVLPHRFASHYDYLHPNKFKSELIEQVTPNISLQQLPVCDYQEIIEQNHYTYTQQLRESVLRSSEIRSGGEYYPEECRARYSTAIIVPYRQREEQLNDFLIYMHNYLRHQQLHYRIFLVEQYDSKPFNRAKLFNIGSVIAAKYDFPCLILHDVDLMPLKSGNLYACTEQPRHMCSALDLFRYNLPYRGLFGGVVAIRTSQFRFINGMSNIFQGWGGEDDDLYERLTSSKLSICRFPPDYGEYTMLRHKKEKPNSLRLQLLKNGPLRYQVDGLNSLSYKEKDTRVHSLFTHILVET